MHIGRVIVLHKRFERDVQQLAVMQDAAVVIGQTPGPGIDIEPLGELHVLGEAAELGIGVAAIKRPVPPAGAVIIFQDLDFVAGLAQLIGRRHSGHSSAQNQDRGALRIAIELDGFGKAGLGGIAHLRHRLIHHGAASHGTNQIQQRAPVHRHGIPVSHGAVPLCVIKQPAGPACARPHPSYHSS